MKLNKQLGEHYLVELIGCNSDRIKSVENVKKIFLDAAEKGRATIIKHFFHQFEPFGVSGVILIAESHISLHTWPEENYTAVDIFTCGEEMDAETCIAALAKGFNATDVKSTIVLRGF